MVLPLFSYSTQNSLKGGICVTKCNCVIFREILAAPECGFCGPVLEAKF